MNLQPTIFCDNLTDFEAAFWRTERKDSGAIVHVRALLKHETRVFVAILKYGLKRLIRISSSVNH